MLFKKIIFVALENIICFVLCITKYVCQFECWKGEAAGLAMGLVMLGTKSATAIEDMVAVSISKHYSDHSKKEVL